MGDISDDMELADVAAAIDDAGFNVCAVRVIQAMNEIKNLRSVLRDALLSFESTQTVSDYPASHWSRRAEILIMNSAY